MRRGKPAFSGPVRYAVVGLGYISQSAVLNSGEVDAVYIALPNTMHRDFTVQAARRGIRVLCEKPLAVRAPKAFTRGQEIRRPPIRRAPMVNAAPPSQ